MMKRFQNILVGVDLSQGDRFVAEPLGSATVEGVKRALWLAKLNGAKITFLYSFDVSESTQELIQDASEKSPLIGQARDALEVLVDKAVQEGIDASLEVAFGKSWIVLIRRVLAHHHDLVVVGTRNPTMVSRVLFGSTGMKLLGRCPCPVWITKPSDSSPIASVLVAHDLTPVGTLALQLGASMSELQGAALHVLHAVEHPEYDQILPPRIPSIAAGERHAAARSQIETELKDHQLSAVPNIVITDDEPSAAILQQIENEGIELLVMGTIARTGISGVITGNTAEQLLPSVSCSILAVKPQDFESPVRLEATSTPAKE